MTRKNIMYDKKPGYLCILMIYFKMSPNLSLALMLNIEATCMNIFTPKKFYFQRRFLALFHLSNWFLFKYKIINLSTFFFLDD